MADRPLRPATHRSLGEPLPHQQANGPRAHPDAEAEAPFPILTDARTAHPVLARVSSGCPGHRGRLPTCYSPVRHSLSDKITSEQARQIN